MAGGSPSVARTARCLMRPSDLGPPFEPFASLDLKRRSTPIGGARVSGSLLPPPAAPPTSSRQPASTVLERSPTVGDLRSQPLVALTDPNHPEFGRYYFESIAERRDFYRLFHNFAKRKDIYWFGPAALVTDRDGVGAADRYNLWYIHNPTEDFLRSGNQYLSRSNVEQFADNIYNNRPIPGAENQSGRLLDYRMVEIDQRNLEKFIDIYFAQPAQAANQSKIMGEISDSFNDEDSISLIRDPEHRAAILYAMREFRKVTSRRLSFEPMADRVFLGKQIIDWLRR